MNQEWIPHAKNRTRLHKKKPGHIRDLLRIYMSTNWAHSKNYTINSFSVSGWPSNRGGSMRLSRMAENLSTVHSVSWSRDSANRRATITTIKGCQKGGRINSKAWLVKRFYNVVSISKYCNTFPTRPALWIAHARIMRRTKLNITHLFPKHITSWCSPSSSSRETWVAPAECPYPAVVETRAKFPSYLCQNGSRDVPGSKAISQAERRASYRIANFSYALKKQGRMVMFDTRIKRVFDGHPSWCFINVLFRKIILQPISLSYSSIQAYI